MGALADAALDAGGRVTGVIPDFLSDREVAHEHLTEQLIVDDLFERKAMMIERSSAFVALPGGIGTYDEILEVIAWRQLRQLRQPVALFNVAGYFDPFVTLLEHTVAHDFLGKTEVEHLIIDDDPGNLVDRIGRAWKA